MSLSSVSAVPHQSWVRQIMGLPISVHVRGPDARSDLVARRVERMYDELRAVDALFSTYSPTSAVSRINRGELALEDAGIVVDEVVRLCRIARERTDGCFDAWLPDGKGGTWFDPSGLVKGWAVERAARRLNLIDGHDFAVNAGGDILLRRQVPGTQPWRVGIEDPDSPDRVLLVVPLESGAVATSGSAHRGSHIVDPRTGKAAGDARAVTVVGPSLLWADVFATAAVVQGAGALAWLEALSGYEGLVVRDGTVATTSGFPAHS
ncbi:MAG: FAD:protein transferase [Actinomycetota bacterium]|jgi:thiamine biosynthesis lipoprotein|nr:FAD:protein transferase [Actinomycetota bacterium]